MSRLASKPPANTDLADEVPGLLGELAAAFGVDVAMRLAQWRGGIRLFVPKAPIDAHHEIAKRIGVDAANWLVKRCGGSDLYVPRCVTYLRNRRDDEIRELGRTMSAPALALKFDLHERQVWRILARLPPDTRQQQLL
ncbi:Mor transcription activator family protein [Hydrocarboniphaga effusa]|uniref:Mor transcription activator family protein n=1 Tax=Hydrocarboniphaga effusa TaxID=243629 RepID=UPI003BAC2B0A